MAKQRKKKKRRNPDNGTIAAIVIGSAIATAGVIYVVRKRNLARRVLTPTTPGEPQIPTPTTPTIPTTPTEPSAERTVLATYESPYATSEAYRTAEGFNRASVSMPSQELNFIDDSFDTAADADAFAQRKVIWFGQPTAADDLFVDVIGSLESDYRGAIWQSVTEGSFYFTAEGPSSSSTTAPYQGIDQAKSGLSARLAQWKAQA